MALFLLNRYFYPGETATSRMCTSPAFGLAAGARARALFDTRFTEAGGIAAWEGILKELKLGGAAASPAPAGVVETPA